MNSKHTRRNALTLGAAALGAAFLPKSSAAKDSKITFGIVADLHHGLMPDAHRRLDAFLEAASQRSLDFIIQLGDFCHPKPDARGFLASWHSYRGKKHNVLGNHDMDFGTKQEIMERWEMPKKYYSFDAGDFHFAVLDCNYLNNDGQYSDFANGNYFGTGNRRDWVSPEQIEWLRADIAATERTTVVFTHQGIGDFWVPDAQVNRVNVREALSRINQQAGRQKVAAVFSGHHHADHHGERDGVNYLLVNSASYYWVGEQYGSLAKYKDPLFEFVTLETAGRIVIEGRRSSFVPPTPTELGHPHAPYVTASIDDRIIPFTPAAASGGPGL